MPLRLHCQLTLAALRMDMGAVDEAGQLLQDAELCMTRCVEKVPWQHVQFCMLKLRWRRLKYRMGTMVPSAPLDAPNCILYRDPKTFASCIAPSPSSPLYRTFLERAKPPQIVSLSEWVPPHERQPEEAYQLYMQERMPALHRINIFLAFIALHRLQEFLQVARLALKEGGHDVRQLLELFDEALEELLRTEAPKPLFQRIYPFFACFSAMARNRKALLFEPPQGAGPAPVDAEKLPLRVSLNLQRQLQRQAAEGALAYSRGSRWEVPSGGHVLVRWSPPEQRATAEASQIRDSKPPVCACTSLLVFLCPMEEQPPLLARSLVQTSSLQERADILATDLQHCRPATSVSASYVEQELREAVKRVM
eukprot:g30593.t1